MTSGPARVQQITLTVSDLDRSEAFYRDAIGLEKSYKFGDLIFFNCGDIHLVLSKSPEITIGAWPTYLSCTDIGLMVHKLKRRGVFFPNPPHLAASMPDHDLWVVFFKDPDGHPLALMQQAPKGHVPRGVR